MDLLLTTSDDTIVTAIQSAAETLGHVVHRWSPVDGELSDALAEPARIVIFDGLEELASVETIKSHILVFAQEADLQGFGDCPHAISEFVLKPFSQQELLARISGLCAQPSWIEKTHIELLGQAVNSASDIFELTNPQAAYEHVNPAFERVLGFSPEEALGKMASDLIRSDYHDSEYFSEIKRCLDAGESWSGVIVSKTRAGENVHLESTIAPVTNRKGQVTHHVAVKRDITERLVRENTLAESNRALEQARDAAVSASRAKSEFLANMSHELRTPLNAIIGYSEMLIEDYDQDSQTNSDLGRIRSAGKHLLSLINDVLNISKIEADKIELFPEEFSVRELVDSVQETLKPLALENNNRFSVSCSEDVDLLFADKMRLKQVLLNILSNACKFTQSGEVNFEVDVVGDGLVRHVRFQVRDTGIGISEEQGERLFKPFAQADSSTTRKFGGTGLGLAISQRFVDMMQGSLDFTSALGEGATFVVTIPLIQTCKSCVTTGCGGPSTGPTILVIDDDASVRELFARCLGGRGFRVSCSPTGQEGIRIASRIQPDVIVLDVKMPGMSGWEVLSTLKLEEQTASIPVIMMTTLQQQDVGRALGAADYLIKPIETDQLTKVIGRFISKPGAQILVVEDDEATRELMCRMLTGAGHQVLEAENGQVALDVLRQQCPDLIVLDLMMPVMDGFTFLHQMHEDADCPNIPTIVATARSLSEVERRNLQQVTERVIQKGAYTRDELLDTICQQAGQLIERRRSCGGSRD